MSDLYKDWVQRFAALLHEPLPVPPTGDVPALPELPADAPRCLLLSPHPDDECLTGALPLRLRREAGWQVVNVAVTLGSAPARQAARAEELRAACARLGFALDLPDEPPPEAIARALTVHRPQLVLMPHVRDAQPTHQRVHAWGCAAIEAIGRPVDVAFTEFWSTLERPNLLVLSDPATTADLVAALACHEGEVARNPYHLRLPAGMADTVRRAGELVMGPGMAPPRGDFATAYERRRFDGRQWLDAEAPRIWQLGESW
ncbi:PIG-L deacetylase family protein [Inhella sp.]|uniref:PIG-L deacetylase family protein n=1 Tax=Inhella sp. TaxID=1921806 RepID=UPI0035AD7921